MNGIDFFFDTNAILYFLSGNSCMSPYIEYKFGYSIITEMELLSYSKLTDQEEKSIRGFLTKNQKFSITQEIIDKTIQLRKAYSIKLPDAIIAASAIVNHLSLVTADRGFEKIKELEIKLITPEIRQRDE